MGAFDLVLTVGFGVVAAANITVGGAMLWRSRHQPDAIRWLGQRLAAPRWAGSVLLLEGLAFALFVLGIVLFEPRTTGGRFMLLAAAASAVGGIIAGLMWFLRRDRTAQSRAMPGD